MTWKCHVDESTNGRYNMILDRDLITTLEMDIMFSDNVIIGADIKYEWCTATIVDVSNYWFISLSDKTVKPEEFFINSYFDKCLKYKSVISSTWRMCRILYINYEKANLNKFMAKKCQHLSTEERYRLLSLLNGSQYLFNGTLGTCNTTMVDL